MKNGTLYLKNNKLLSFIEFFEKYILVFISFSFVFKISISTPAILLLLFFNLNNIRQTSDVIYKLQLLIFLSIYLIFGLSCFLIPEEPIGILIKSLGFIFIPLLFYVKKFNKSEILYFVYSFLIFQMIHIVFEDFIMIKGIYIDNLKSYESLISLVENEFIIERPYFALNCLLAIICSKYLYDEKKINFLGILTISLIIILSLLLIAARLAMGISVIIFLIILIQEKKVRIKHYIILLVIIIISILTFGKHALERITFKDGEPRIAIWNCVASIIKSNEFNYFVGEFSSQRVNDKLIVCYNSKPISEGPYWWIGKKRFNYNTHNQFLWFFTSYGIIGLSLFLSIFILQIFNYFKRANFYSLLFVLVFFSQSVFENILCRQLGIYLFVWFSFILLSKKEFSIYE